MLHKWFLVYFLAGLINKFKNLKTVNDTDGSKFQPGCRAITYRLDEWQYSAFHRGNIQLAEPVMHRPVTAVAPPQPHNVPHRRQMLFRTESSSMRTSRSLDLGSRDPYLIQNLWHKRIEERLHPRRSPVPVLTRLSCVATIGVTGLVEAAQYQSNMRGVVEY